MLNVSGINTGIFKIHSTHSASSLHRRFSGLFRSDIIKRGTWSNETTREKFYKKPIMTSDENFQKAVVNY